MGCVQVKQKVRNEEQAILEGEQKLLYFKSQFVDILATHKESSSKKISNDRFKAIALQHNLAYVKDPVDSKILNFYSKLKKGDAFSTKLLTLLPVLLCKGSADSKMRALISLHFDNSNMISDAEFLKIMDEIFEMAVNVLPTLVEPSNRKRSYTDERLKDYLAKANFGRTQAKKELVDEIFGEHNRTASDIISSYFKREGNHIWLNSSDLRLKLAKIGKREIRRGKGEVEQIVELKCGDEHSNHDNE